LRKPNSRGFEFDVALKKDELMSGDDETESLRAEVKQLGETVENLQSELQHTRHRRKRRTVRYQSSATVLGWPLISVAIGPDEQSRQMRGRAVGFIAVGDIATGVFAVGRISGGVIAIGGIAAGLVAVGGVAIGVIAGVGGVASGYFCVGGVAIGVETIGGSQINA